jgi:hypothetical protein
VTLRYGDTVVLADGRAGTVTFANRPGFIRFVEHGKSRQCHEWVPLADVLPVVDGWHAHQAMDQGQPHVWITWDGDYIYEAADGTSRLIDPASHQDFGRQAECTP